MFSCFSDQMSEWGQKCGFQIGLLTVGARQGGLNISETADLLGHFHMEQSLEFSENRVQK